jgi:hypothetical protein
MSKIYLINVGANSQHSSIARSPRFANGKFVFVPFPYKGDMQVRPYPVRCKPFVNTDDPTHDDPDWQNLTYGDDCANRRAAALGRVVEGDILLFWGMLWENTGDKWDDFSKPTQAGWYLIGALHVAEILKGSQRPTDARPNHIARAAQNIHFENGQLSEKEHVFIGERRHSAIFPKAVDLKVYEPDGLMYRTMRAASGAPLALNGRPRWYSSLRSCRALWDLTIEDHRQLAEIVRDEILRENSGYDLLAGIH